MSRSVGPLFELAVGGEGRAAAERLLSEFAEDSRLAATVEHAALFASADQLVLRIRFASAEALEEFLAGRASIFEERVRQVAPDAVIASAIYQQGGAAAAEANCLNCGTPLRGQYCGQCGQRGRSRLISLWELTRDAFGDMFELDSRLWQTLIPLTIRPGQLTADYLRGRRARYMPPFRMYLVLSLLFFVVAFFDPREDLAILFVDESALTGDLPDAADEADRPRLNVSVGGQDPEEGDCDEMDVSELETMPDFIRQRVTIQRLERLCAAMKADDGRALEDRAIENIPAGLIVLLPVMALVLKLLYPFARRYYVEHLLFVVHFHAFFFLVLSLQMLWTGLIDALSAPAAVGIVPAVLASIYIPAYLFRAMRRVYRQGFFFTLLKYLILLVAYLIGFALITAVSFVLAAFSI